jgi:RNA polymerase sigma-70 factor (ECF subfamily)|tara:strand:- start:1995 stop:2741 length:747 start_codon:yes stop_codon:yes gene_type:complete
MFGELIPLFGAHTLTYKNTRGNIMDLSLNTYLNVPANTSKKQQSGKLVVMSEREKDNVLVLRVQRGDKVAFELLFTKYQRRVSRLVSRFIRSEAEVEDVVQDSFIKAYKALANFRGDSAFYTWLYRIAVNTAKNYLVAASKRPISLSQFEKNDDDDFEEDRFISNSTTPESELITKQIAETVNKTIDELPADLREAIMLREIEGMSYEDIAEAMECPIGTVRSRIFRAREAISQKIKPMLDVGEGKRW